MKRSYPIFLTLPLLSLPAAGDLFPNGDFTNGVTSWEEVSGSGTYEFSYPDSDGNPGGFGVIDHSAADGGFGIWVGNDGQPLTLDSLGLSAGSTYNFTLDMKLLSGSNIGGFKLDFTNGGEDAESTDDLRTSLIGDGSDWETYTFTIAIPAGVDGFKVVPLWGVDSSVGFDNIGFDPTPIVQPIINPDFSSGQSGWSETGSDETSWSYPETGGNPDGYGVMTNTGDGFGIWVANNNQIIPLETLELEAGTTVNFIQDMILLSGDTIGGVKIDFFTGADMTGTTEEIFGTLIGDGSTWETYTFPVQLPEGIDGIKIVPLWGAGSSVGYDNFRAEAQPVLPPPTDAASEPVFVEGTIVSWNPTNTEKLYQPQASADGSTWVDLGPAYPGVETTSILDPDSAPFHRVLEKDPAGQEALINGDFEISNFADPACAESWVCFTISDQIPTLIDTDAQSGSSSIRIAVQNDDTPTPNQGEIQQNLGTVGGFVVGGETYTFSFWAKQVSSGVSYVQKYQLQWIDAAGAPLPGIAVPFKDFAGGNGTWARVVEPNLVAPAGAAGVFIQIFGGTGAVPSEDAKGEVLIDNVSLAIGAQSDPVVFETTNAPGAGVFMQTKVGQQYKAQFSDDLENYTDLSGVFTGNGLPAGAGTAFDQQSRFYRFLLIEEEAN